MVTQIPPDYICPMAPGRCHTEHGLLWGGRPGYILTITRSGGIELAQDDNDKVVELAPVLARAEYERKEQAAKKLRKQFQQAMGWNNRPKPKRSRSGRKRGKGRRQ